ncbi:hypothetical protein F0U61_45140 [Archangium violaceum]|uniref:hypothetical protein n=1 Tax=Archangium violaceum TaxID=83451 RepID=UPI002B2DC8FC|nr:hypothetical protein F0U61_45140 [Archangium violaceum]
MRFSHKFVDSYKFRHFPYKPLRNFQRFEDMSGHLIGAYYGLRDMQPHGLHGQRQRGVDYFGHDAKGAWVGVQAKLRSSGSLSCRAVAEDVREAEGFHHLIQPLRRYVIVTSALPGKKLRELVEGRSRYHVSNRMFGIEIFFWPDVCYLLEKHPDVARRFGYKPPTLPGAYESRGIFG